MPDPSQHRPQPDGLALTVAQLAVLVALGIALWFIAVMLIRALQPLGALHAPGVWLTYALVVPGTLPVVSLARRLARLARAQTAAGLAAVTAAAALCDANTLLWHPALYGPDPLGAAAAVFWGAGVALFLGVAMSR